ncbi:MAG: hypothetical protein K0S18_148 [Anaerocolumna sp.]|nr:hypothetical protein [Anaerocolumna sp.]
MENNYNYDFVIVEMASIKVYDFLINGESVAEAEARGNKYYQDELKLVTSHLENYGGEYWENQVKAITKKVESGCKLMTYEQFKEAERKHLLDGELTEVTADQFEDSLNVLPPICWTTHNNVEMFCMSEMYTGSYTSQYAHDKRTGKYYTKLVDCKDRSTWICELLTV